MVVLNPVGVRRVRIIGNFDVLQRLKRACHIANQAPPLVVWNLELLLNEALLQVRVSWHGGAMCEVLSTLWGPCHEL